jgi:integrase
MGKRAHGEGTISQRKDGTWEGKLSVGYKPDGKRDRRTVYGKTQKEVRAKLDELKQQLANGALSDTKLTVKAYLERWLPEKARHVEESSIESYERLIRVHIVPRLGRVQLAKLTALQVQTMMGEVADTVGVRTANASRTLLFSALKQAVRWQLISRNVVEAVDPLKQPTKEIRLWSTAEAVRFLDTIQGHRLHAAFYLEMSTGLRRGELLGLRWQDIDGNMLWVRQQLTYSKGRFIFKATKTERSTRRVAVSPDVLEVLELHRKQQEAERELLGEAWPSYDLVFTSEVGTPIHPRNFQRTWDKLKKKAQVPHVRLHDLRHLHVSLLVKQGFDPRTIADRVGHLDASFTLRRYSQMFEEQRQATAISITDLLTPQRPAQALN